MWVSGMPATREPQSFLPGQSIASHKTATGCVPNNTRKKQVKKTCEKKHDRRKIIT